MKRFIFVISAVLMLAPAHSSAQKLEKQRKEVLSGNRGYYKDVFMDSGINLNSRRTLPAADALGLSMEMFVSAKNKKLTATDTLIQKNIFCGYEEDTNGWLLYPDGAPRYRVVYVNGGKSNKHATSLTKTGRSNFKQYIAAGGSYVGTCAGAFLASQGAKTKKNVKFTKLYLGLWPGWAGRSGLIKSATDMRIERKSPLLRYYDYGKDHQIDSVRHNGGCYAYEKKEEGLPCGTEILARYIFEDTEKVTIDNKVSIWAYKPDAKTGRTVVTGSHPEGVRSGERLELMSAMLLYAMDGNRKPETKARLKFGQKREMNRYSEDKAPEYTAIGDRQYHHFIIDVPKKCAGMTVTLKGYEGKDDFDLTLCANPRGFAYADDAMFVKDGTGCSKEISIKKPKPGKWYISVFCSTTVTSTTGKYGTEYSGRTDVLNGVPYSIIVKQL